MKCGFKKLDKAYGVTEVAFQAESKNNRNNYYFKDHIDASTTQKIDTRVVMNTFNRWRFKGAGKPRFKGKNRKLKSLEGKSNKQGIVIRLGDPAKETVTSIVWQKRRIPLDLDFRDAQGYQSAALELIGNIKVAFVRIVKRTYKGKERLYAKVVLNTAPFVKAKDEAAYKKASGKKSAYDLGVSSLAYYSEARAGLYFGLAEIKELHQKLKRYQRKASFLLRMANPDNYVKVIKRPGRKKKKVVKWHRKKNVRDTVKTKHYLEVAAIVKELHRKIAAKRKYAHDCFAKNY